MRNESSDEMNNKKGEATFVTDLLLPVLITGEVVSYRKVKPFYDGTERYEAEVEFKVDGELKTQTARVKTSKGMALDLGKKYDLTLQAKLGRVLEKDGERKYWSFTAMSAVETKKGGRV